MACYAVGWKASSGLVEAWKPNAATWTVQLNPGTAAPDTGNTFSHVSCTGIPGGSVCQAVGYRYDPAVAPAQRSYETLAELQTGTGWQLQTTPNP